MGILAHFSSSKNYIKSTNKIPEYARDFKKEYLFIIGINKELGLFYKHLDKINDGLFESHRVDRIKYFIKRFLRGEERGRLKDISEFEIKENDVNNFIKIKEKFYCFKLRYDFFEDDDYNPYPGFENIYYDFELFFNKLKIKYEEDSDIEDFEIILPNSDSDSDSDSDNF